MPKFSNFFNPKTKLLKGAVQMIKRKFSNIIIVAIIAASLMFAGIPRQPAIVSAEATTLSGYAGMVAYTQILDPEFDLEAVKPAFMMIEYQEAGFFVGTLDLPIYETTYDPLVLVTSDGLIVAFYPFGDPAGKIVDVRSKNLNETLLEKAVKIVAAIPEEDLPIGDIFHYDFGNPLATKLLLVAEYEPDGNEFTLSFEAGNTYSEKSYAFYRTFSPSFTMDNDLMDQVNFVLDNADYTGTGYYGTIYGQFSTIDFDPEHLHTFAVQAGDHLGFGSLAILYDGVAEYTVDDKDFLKEIDLTSPGIDPTFDLTPSAPSKSYPDDAATGVVLNPTLSWDSSTTPNYEYCIDTSAPDGDPLTEDCNTKWISVGSKTEVALSNLFYETTYYWQVRAKNSYAVVEADGGAWFSFTTDDGVAPEAFLKLTTDLKETLDSLSRVTMTWEPSYGAYYYEVCVDSTAECIAPELWHNVGLATSATMGELLLNTTYYWQVRAWNGFDLGGVDNPLYYTYADGGWQTFTTRTFSKLRPYDEEVYNITLPLKWEATPIATQGYEYCIDEIDDDVCTTKWNKVTGTSVVVKRLVAGTHYWQVRIFGSQEEANDGDWWEFDVLSKKDVSKITLFKVSPINGSVDQLLTNLALSWKATKSAIAYEYCYFPIDDTDTTPISDDDICIDEDQDNPDGDFWFSPVPITSTSTTISGLSDTTTYLWQVRANIGSVTDPDWIYADKGDYWAFTTLIPLPE
jgi:hypothetical protein